MTLQQRVLDFYTRAGSQVNSRGGRCIERSTRVARAGERKPAGMES
jgi:hypothetical protein